MGQITGVFKFEKRVEAMEVLEVNDVRRRNSMAAYISQFLTFEGEEYQPIIDKIKEEKNPRKDGKPVRVSKFGKIGDAISMGNVRELRNQVFVEFRHINRQYPDHHHQNTILHMVCQEGYHTMLSYILNPANRNTVDENQLDISPKNDRDRTPLLLCFTAPIATLTGMHFGLDGDGNVKASKPDDIERETDWVAPGGPKSRETCIKLLLDNGADANDKDFQDFTPLHYAAIWGWTTTVRILVEHRGDINAVTTAGRTPLMYAVDFDQEPLVLWLASQAKALQVALDAVDVDGCSALVLAVDKGGAQGLAMAKALLAAGCDPNVLTLKRKSALKIACAAQDLDMVHALLDSHTLLRRKSALNLLREEAFSKIQFRLHEEERKEEEAAKRAEREEEHRMKTGTSSRTNKRIGEAWVEYRDKKSKKPFFYNAVTRKSQWDLPRDFKPDRTRLVKDAVFGMHFYH